MRALAATQENETQNLRHRLTMLFVYFLTIAVAANLSAQDRDAEKDEELKIRVVKLKTRDGVELGAVYCPSELEKKAIPVLIIHEWKGQASPYSKLCLALQKEGCAILVPEYRGHGGSREYTDRNGESKKFNVSRMSKRDIENIIGKDLETTKGFLKRENNEGKLNLNALVIIGIREGAVLAGQWAQRDWKFPSVGRMKQGQDVKALIYVSLAKQIKGISIESTLTDENLIQLPMMLVAGKRSNDAKETDRIARRVQGMKKRIGRGTTAGFKLLMPDTKLSGPALVNEVSTVIPAIVDFITSEVKVTEEENPWVERK